MQRRLAGGGHPPEARPELSSGGSAWEPIPASLPDSQLFSDPGLAWSIDTSDLKSSASSPLLSWPRILLGRWMHRVGKAQGCSLATEGHSAPGLQLAAGMSPLAGFFLRIQLEPAG